MPWPWREGKFVCGKCVKKSNGISCRIEVIYTREIISDVVQFIICGFIN